MKKIMLATVAGMLVLSATACTAKDDTPKPIAAATVEGKYITPQDTSKDGTPGGPATSTPVPTLANGMGQGAVPNKPAEAPAEAATHEMVLPNTGTLKVKAGDKVHVSFYEGKHGATYVAELFYSSAQSKMKTVNLGSFTPDENGVVEGEVTVPANFAPGIYTLTLTLNDEILGGNIEVS